MLVMYIAWLVINRLPTLNAEASFRASSQAALSPLEPTPRRLRWFDLVDTATVDLTRDEHKDDVDDLIEDQERARRLQGRAWVFWKLYYFVA